MVNHIISADVGVIFKRHAFGGPEHRGLRPLFQSGTPPLATLDSLSRDHAASQASVGEPTIPLENAAGSTSGNDVPEGTPETAARVPPVEQLTMMFASSEQDTSKYEQAPPSTTSRTKKFSSLLEVLDRQSLTSSSPRPPSPSSPMTPSSPISPMIASMRRGVFAGADGKTVPVLHAPKDPKSGRVLNENDPCALSGLTQADQVADANSQMLDQLNRQKFWWLLEVIPLWQHYQDRNAYWHKGFHLNRGRARDVSDPKPLFHSSVKLREGYTPKARVRDSEPTYVDF
ncbi:hypothetical protein FRC01_000288 [Tulasnella sp. 417]|nr:hypothetical protein FRC01_000288 [Tulasnella sp. 417]